MTDKLAPIPAGLLAAIAGSLGKDGRPLPFVREIFLLSCHVAGTEYHDAEEAEPELAVGTALVFQREPDNRHDELASRILDPKGRMLGYVPRAKNEVLARLLDAGKLVFGVLEAKQRRGHWLHLAIRVYLRDL